MTLEEFTLLPPNFQKMNPHALVLLYPETMNIYVYHKKMTKYSFYLQVKLAEDIAKKMGFILLPGKCIHWKRAKAFAENRRVKIGRNTFYMLKINELTKKEHEKLIEVIHKIAV